MVIRSITLLKLSRFLIISFFTIFTFIVLIPYINGYGCDFDYTEIFDEYDMVGSCNNGVLQTHIIYHDNDFSYYKKFLWLKYNDKALLINISSKLPQERILQSFPDFELRYDQYKHNENLFAFYLIREAKNGETIFISKEPVDAMYVFAITGKLSYF
jgi:hypothetical protein